MFSFFLMNIKLQNYKEISMQMHRVAFLIYSHCNNNIKARGVEVVKTLIVSLEKKKSSSVIAIVQSTFLQLVPKHNSFYLKCLYRTTLYLDLEQLY